MAPQEQSELPLRADAKRNRERVLDAARERFAADGLNASMEDIAKQAGVGIATLYRRFPTRQDLVAATFENKMIAYADAVERALSLPDARQAFVDYVTEIAGMQLEDRGFTEVLTMSFPTARAFEAARMRAYQQLGLLIDRAKAAGVLHPDFVQEDLVIALMANAGVVAASGSISKQASSRLIAFLLLGFTNRSAEPLPPAPSPRETYTALLRLKRA